jgi:hypothetical protein
VYSHLGTCDVVLDDDGLHPVPLYPRNNSFTNRHLMHNLSSPDGILLAQGPESLSSPFPSEEPLHMYLELQYSTGIKTPVSPI